MIRFRNDWCEVHEADCREVASGLEPGSFSLAILDGPYGMGKAAWDRVKLDDLGEWYRPHLEDMGRLCGASASLYVWNTAEGWARLDPVIRGMGWCFETLVIWDKVNSAAFLSDNQNKWIDTTEVCGHYTMGNVVTHTPRLHTNVWRLPEISWRLERLDCGEITDRGIGGSSRRQVLHPSQKPIQWADRMIRASSRPGERIWAPFGGTLREALAATRIGRADPAEARYVVTCELNQDGVDYLGPAIDQIRGDYDAKAAPGQMRLFGGA